MLRDIARIAARLGHISKTRARLPRAKSVRPADRFSFNNKAPGAEPATALFPPQLRDWMLCSEAALTPRAARRVARETATQTFDKAAAAINEDWNTDFDAKQLERWALKFGARIDAERAREMADSECGLRPTPPAQAPALLVIGLDGA